MLLGGMHLPKENMGAPEYSYYKIINAPKRFGNWTTGTAALPGVT
jgi:hypothetical protein